MSTSAAQWINAARAERGLPAVTYLGPGQAQQQVVNHRNAGRYGHDVGPTQYGFEPGGGLQSRSDLLVKAASSRAAVGAFVASPTGHRWIHRSPSCRRDHATNQPPRPS